MYVESHDLAATQSSFQIQPTEIHIIFSDLAGVMGEKLREIHSKNIILNKDWFFEKLESKGWQFSLAYD